MQRKVFVSHADLGGEDNVDSVGEGPELCRDGLPGLASH